MRHGAVDYFDSNGQPVQPENVPLSDKGRTQAAAAGKVLANTRLDRVITSQLPRTRQTAEAVLSEQSANHDAPPIESLEALNEIRGGRLNAIPNAELARAFTGAFQPIVEENVRFLGGETIGDLLDRVLPVFDELLDDRDWDTTLLVLHGGVNRALLSRVLTGRRMFLGAFEQAPACINVLDVGYTNIVRAVNINPLDPLHGGTRNTTMEELLLQYQAGLAKAK
jgi:probable phosphoglycerate mutase